MSMEISRNQHRFQTNDANPLKEKQPLDRADKTKEAKKEQEDAKASNKASVLQDEYISSEKSGAKPSGLYRFERDENGNRKIFFDDPNKSRNAKGKELREENADNPTEDKDLKQPKAGSSGKPEEKCTTNTDRVDREIRKLKEKKQQLEQQLRAAVGNEEKTRQLEKKLAQVKSELSQKDNDTYRRQNALISE